MSRNATASRVYRPFTEQVRQLGSAQATVSDLLKAFDVFDPEFPQHPSLGAFLFVRVPHLLIYAPALRRWVATMSRQVHVRIELAQKFELATDADLSYTLEGAEYALREEPQLHELLVRCMLAYLGFRRARNWELATGLVDPELGMEPSLIGGVQSLQRIILQHLAQEASWRDIQLFMGGAPGEDETFNNVGLLSALTTRLFAAADICRTRCPELFFYRGRRVFAQLDDETLGTLFQLTLNVGAYDLTSAQKHELLHDDFIPMSARPAFQRAWSM